MTEYNVKCEEGEKYYDNVGNKMLALWVYPLVNTSHLRGNFTSIPSFN